VGRWEVDGKIEKIDDPALARAILDKVNNMNTATGLQGLLAGATFAILPQSVSSPLAFFALLFGGKPPMP
jgi:hypothetical protein